MIDAGMQVNSRDLPFSTLLDYLYRNEEGYDEWAGPNTYGLYGLAQALQPKNDFSLDFTEEGTLFHDYDENLARLSRQMLQAKDDATYAELWRDFILAWNEELPMIPLYQNIYYDFMDPHIKGLTPDTYWPFERAVLYATVEE
jgi:ABC-type transport system substrate-binding protein